MLLVVLRHFVNNTYCQIDIFLKIKIITSRICLLYCRHILLSICILLTSYTSASDTSYLIKPNYGVIFHPQGYVNIDQETFYYTFVLQWPEKLNDTAPIAQLECNLYYDNSSVNGLEECQKLQTITTTLQKNFL